MLRNIFGVILVVWVFVNSLLIIFIDTWEAIDKLILILLNLGILLTIYVYIFKNSKDNKRKLLLYFALFQLLMFFIEQFHFVLKSGTPTNRSWNLLFFPLQQTKEPDMLFVPKEANKGQGLVEYALILFFIALAVIVALSFPGPQIGNVFSNIVANFQCRSDRHITEAFCKFPTCRRSHFLFITKTDCIIKI